MIKAIFFDFDNTLEDWDIALEAIRKEFSRTVEEETGINRKKFFEMFMQIDREFAGSTRNPLNYNRKVWLREAFRRLNASVSEKRIEELERLHWKIGLANIRRNPGVVETLKKLKMYKKIIVTDCDGHPNNYIKNRKIRKLGLRKYFDLILTGADVNTTKPDKKFWRVAMRKFRLKPSECIMVGDNPVLDLEPAKELGMATVWFQDGSWRLKTKRKKFKYVDYRIKSMPQLLEILKKCQKKTG